MDEDNMWSGDSQRLRKQIHFSWALNVWHLSEQMEIKPFLEGQSDKWEIKENNGERLIPILGIEKTAGITPWCAAATTLA